MIVNRSSNSALALAVALFAGGMLSLGGCSKNADGSLSLFGNGSSSTSASVPTASTELTADQGKKLLEDIRNNPNRLNSLTIPEKRFLAKTALADEKRRKRGED